MNKVWYSRLMNKRKITLINLITVSVVLILFLSGCGNASSNEKMLRRAFGITHADQAEKIATAFNNANLGNIEEIKKDKSSSENKYIIYTDDDNEYILYLSSNYGMQALIDNKTKEAIYSSVQ